MSVALAMYVDGWTMPEELLWMAATGGGKRVLEVGSYKGRSALAWLAGGAKELVCLDRLVGPWPPEVMRLFLTTNLAAYKGKARIVTGDSMEEKVWAGLTGFDVVFVDGDHTEAFVRNDIARGMAALRPGGLLCGHDYTEAGVKVFDREWPDVRKVVDELFPQRMLPAGTIWAVEKPLG